MWKTMWRSLKNLQTELPLLQFNYSLIKEMLVRIGILSHPYKLNSSAITVPPQLGPSLGLLEHS